MGNVPSRPRRPARPARARAAVAPPSIIPELTGPCLCGAAETYAACCGRYHRGDAAAPTAEALMRSRYSAFALRDPVYLIRTWHASTRPSRLDLGDGRTWERLQVLGKSGGSLFDTEGEVRFRATYVEDGARGAQEETSRFIREGGEWLYIGGLAESVRP
ncbi:MAG: hypothetical protein JWN61_3055 [Pseudonocardiales bacterium]|nr:hypothetical protein [Pseudonocardiales bacterium]